jgi:hypothetical protein
MPGGDNFGPLAGVRVHAGQVAQILRAVTPPIRRRLHCGSIRAGISSGTMFVTPPIRRRLHCGDFELVKEIPELLVTPPIRRRLHCGVAFESEASAITM